jgi:hypothetical protein
MNEITIKEAYAKGQNAIEAAKRAAQLMLAQAQHESWEAWQAAFEDFMGKHGCIESKTEKDYFEHHGDSWRRMKTYTAKDGLNFYEVTQFPSTEYGLRVEYWSDGAKSVITYV